MSESTLNEREGDDQRSLMGELSLPTDPEGDFDAVIQRLLAAVRQHLDLDVAFIGQVVGDERVFRYVDTRAGINLISVGDRDPLPESYCHYVLTGQLPEFLADAREHPLAASLRATEELQVATHLSVPITFSDGRTYGTFCCFGTGEAQPEADKGDIRAVRMIAELAGEYLAAMEASRDEWRQREETIRAILQDPDAMTVVFQPLRELRTMEIVGLEALARFPKHDHGPAWFFSEAAAVGLGVAAELRAIELALAALPGIPDPIRLNLNVSPETLYTREFFETIDSVPGERLVVEVTEHAAIEDYADLRSAAARLSDKGIRLAIDDVGMGFSGLNRILESEPQELKLDAAVIRNLHTNLVKHALVETFASFGQRVGFDVVAEGIETAEELEALRELGIGIGQGYYLGRPSPLRDALDPPPAR